MLTVTSSNPLVTPASNTSSSSSASTTDAAAMQDRFMKLLVAQLKNQDPMNPMDNAQMTSQMAQINTVSGLQQVNDTLKNMATQFSSMQMMQGSSLVGHEILTQSNTLTSSSGVAGGAIDLSGKADSVKIEILSPGGQVLDTLDVGAREAGRYAFDWNAASYTGGGNPTFKVTATLAGQPVASTSLARDTVVSVGSENGVMTVQLQGRGSVAYDSVKAIL
jgi:flagellar basal-body rod modification protein FlgD